MMQQTQLARFSCYYVHSIVPSRSYASDFQVVTFLHKVKTVYCSVTAVCELLHHNICYLRQCFMI